jgi:hypothetical protein
MGCEQDHRRPLTDCTMRCESKCALREQCACGCRSDDVAAEHSFVAKRATPTAFHHRTLFVNVGSITVGRPEQVVECKGQACQL